MKHNLNKLASLSRRSKQTRKYLQKFWIRNTLEVISLEDLSVPKPQQLWDTEN